jgi:hypothetical protein
MRWRLSSCGIGEGGIGSARTGRSELTGQF